MTKTTKKSFKKSSLKPGVFIEYQHPGYFFSNPDHFKLLSEPYADNFQPSGICIKAQQGAASSYVSVTSYVLDVNNIVSIIRDKKRITELEEDYKVKSFLAKTSGHINLNFGIDLTKVMLRKYGALLKKVKLTEVDRATFSLIENIFNQVGINLNEYEF